MNCGVKNPNRSKVTQDFQALIDWKVGVQYQCELIILKCKYLLPNNTLHQTVATSISVLCCSHTFTQDLLEAFFENLVSVGITQMGC